MNANKYSPLKISEALNSKFPPTEEQCRIVEHGLEPLLVIAGAGAGKTETLSFRVLSLILNHGISPHQVLALTFTRKATGEMALRLEERLRTLQNNPLAKGRTDLESTVEVSTYDSFANHLVHEYASLADIAAPRKLLDTAGDYQIMHEVVQNYTGEISSEIKPQTVIKQALQLANELGSFDVEPQSAKLIYSNYERRANTLHEQLEKALKTEQQTSKSGITGAADATAKLQGIASNMHLLQELLPVVTQFLKVKAERGLANFNDQTKLAYHLAENPEVTKTMRKRYRVVLLDEFQDTSATQMKLLGTLFQDHPVTAVGDPNQAIYAWRGAWADSMSNFDEHFAAKTTPTHLHLSTTWRNDQMILDGANRIIQPLTEKSNDVIKLNTRENSGKGLLSVSLCASTMHEARTIAHFFNQHWKGKNQTLSNTKTNTKHRTGAVLVRKHSQTLPIAQTLEEYGIKTQIWSRKDLLQTRPVSLIRAALSVANNPDRGDSLITLLEAYSIALPDIKTLWNWVKHTNTEPEERRLTTIVNINPDTQNNTTHWENSEQLTDTARDRIKWLSQMINKIRDSMNLPLESLVALTASLLSLDTDTNTNQHEQVTEFLRFTRKYALEAQDSSVNTFLDYLDWKYQNQDSIEMPESEIDPDAVQILTVHAAKGLEWDVVAVTGMGGGKLEKNSPMTIKHVQEITEESPWFMSTNSSYLLPSQLRGYGTDTADKDIKLNISPNLKKSRNKYAAQLELDHAKEKAAACSLDEMRRLSYVALTRARTHLLVSDSWYRLDNKKPNTPSIFIKELLENPSTISMSEVEIKISEQIKFSSWIPDATELKSNPDINETPRYFWPAASPCPNSQQYYLQESARQLLQTMPTNKPQNKTDTNSNLTTETNTNPLLESAQQIWQSNQNDIQNTQKWRQNISHISVTDITKATTQIELFQYQKLRPLPQPTSPTTQLGTAFHAWVENWWNNRGHGILPLDEFDTLSNANPDIIEALQLHQHAFKQLKFKDNKTPLEIETNHETYINLEGKPVSIKMRIDAVLQDKDTGKFWVIDWKTGTPPKHSEYQQWIHQLGIYRLVYLAEHPEINPEQLHAAYIFIGRKESENRILELNEICQELKISSYNTEYLSSKLNEAQKTLKN